MSRSTYIYIVKRSNKIFGTFTVKNEMCLSILDHMALDCDFNKQDIKIFRYRDNDTITKPVDITDQVILKDLPEVVDNI